MGAGGGGEGLGEGQWQAGSEGGEREGHTHRCTRTHIHRLQI